MLVSVKLSACVCWEMLGMCRLSRCSLWPWPGVAPFQLAADVCWPRLCKSCSWQSLLRSRWHNYGAGQAEILLMHTCSVFLNL